MSDKLFIDTDPLTGISTFVHPGDKPGTWTWEYSADAEPAIEANKVAQTHMPRNGKTRDLSMKWVASIPDIIALKWLMEDGINIFDRNHWPAIRRRLNDPDWRWLRTGLGRV